MNGALQALLLGGLVLLATASSGARLGQVLGLERLEKLGIAGRMSLVFGLGLILLAHVMLVFGALGWLSQGALAVLLAGLVVSGLVPLGRLVREAWLGLARVFKASPYLAAGTGLLALLPLFKALAPPGVNDWDALSYHLAVPELYARWHHMGYVPFIKHASQPFALELVYTLTAVFKTLSAAQVIHWGCFAATLLLIYELARRLAGVRAGLLAMLVFAVAPVVNWEAGIAYVDLALTWACLATLVVMIEALEKPSPRAWVVVGLLSGGAIAFKLSGGLWLVALAAMGLYVLLGSGKLKEAGRGLVLSGGTALLLVVPWLVRSYVWTHNPVYPFLYSIFGGKHWSMEAARHYRMEQLHFGAGHSLWHFLRLPFDLTFNPHFFFDSASLLGSIGPLFLALAPLVLLFTPLPSSLKYANAVALLYTLGWFAGMQQIRYLLPALAVWALTAGLAAAWFADKVKHGRVVVTLIFTLGLATASLGLVFPLMLKAPVVLGLQAPRAYLEEGLQCYRTLEFANRNLPADAKVISFGEPRLLYLERDYLWGEPEYQRFFDYARYPDAEDLARALHREGYDYVLVNFAYFPKTGKLVALLHELLEREQTTLLTSNNKVNLYELYPGRK